MQVAKELQDMDNELYWKLDVSIVVSIVAAKIVHLNKLINIISRLSLDEQMSHSQTTKLIL